MGWRCGGEWSVTQICAYHYCTTYSVGWTVTFLFWKQNQTFFSATPTFKVLLVNAIVYCKEEIFRKERAIYILSEKLKFYEIKNNVSAVKAVGTACVSRYFFRQCRYFKKT